jgi:hypothetical protein
MSAVMVPDRRFRPEPMTGPEAIMWMRFHIYVWYQAPGMIDPQKAYLVGKLKTWVREPGRFRVKVETAGIKFFLDETDLAHLRLPFPLWHHGVSASLYHQQYVGHEKRSIVLRQSNGFHLQMNDVRHACNFARRASMELTVTIWRGGKRKTRVLVPAVAPISGERNFEGGM